MIIDENLKTTRCMKCSRRAIFSGETYDGKYYVYFCDYCRKFTNIKKIN